MKKSISLSLFLFTFIYIARAQPNYILAIDSALADMSLAIALKEIGVRESKENQGVRIREYLDSTKVDYPASYCAAGIYWSMAIARSQLAKDGSSPDIPLPQNGAANSYYSFARKKGRVHYGSIQKGDLIVWRLPGSWQGHIERITRRLNRFWVETIGFNTTAIINGKPIQGVWLKKRNPQHPLGRLKYRGTIHFEKQ